MTARRHRIEAREPIWRGHFRADRITMRHETFAGGESGPLVLEVFDLGEASCVLPWDPAGDLVLLIEQFRGAVATLIRAVGTDFHRNPHTGGASRSSEPTAVPAGALVASG